MAPMEDDTIPSDDDFEALWHRAQGGSSSYGDVVPTLIKEIIRLRQIARGEIFRQATRDFSGG